MHPLPRPDDHLSEFRGMTNRDLMQDFAPGTAPEREAGHAQQTVCALREAEIGVERDFDIVLEHREMIEAMRSGGVDVLLQFLGVLAVRAPVVDPLGEQRLRHLAEAALQSQLGQEYLVGAPVIAVT